MDLIAHLNAIVNGRAYSILIVVKGSYGALKSQIIMHHLLLNIKTLINQRKNNRRISTRKLLRLRILIIVSKIIALILEMNMILIRTGKI